jgi:hypothetical protein
MGLNLVLPELELAGQGLAGELRGHGRWPRLTSRGGGAACRAWLRPWPPQGPPASPWSHSLGSCAARAAQSPLGAPESGRKPTRRPAWLPTTSQQMSMHGEGCPRPRSGCANASPLPSKRLLLSCVRTSMLLTTAWWTVVRERCAASRKADAGSKRGQIAPAAARNARRPPGLHAACCLVPSVRSRSSVKVSLSALTHLSRATANLVDRRLAPIPPRTDRPGQPRQRPCWAGSFGLLPQLEHTLASGNALSSHTPALAVHAQLCSPLGLASTAQPRAAQLSHPLQLCWSVPGLQVCVPLLWGCPTSTCLSAQVGRSSGLLLASDSARAFSPADVNLRPAVS